MPLPPALTRLRLWRAKTPLFATVAALLLALPLAPPAHAGDRLDADDIVSGVFTRDLARALPAGLALQIGSTLDALTNTRGGRARGTANSLLTELRAGFDLERLAALPGLSAEVHLINHALDRINADRVGALTGVTNIEAVHSSTKLYRLWAERTWQDAGLALRVGLFPLEDEFFTIESAASFIHPTNGPQGDYATTLGAAIYNHAGFGARLRTESQDRSRYLMAAILDRPLEDTNFVRTDGFAFPRAPGLHLMLEAGLTPLEATDLREARERYDKTAAGLWAYSRRDEHLSARDARGDPARARSYGWYVLRESTFIARPDGSGLLAGFARLSGSDARASPIATSLNTGFRMSGWVPGRASDTSALMVALHRIGEPWQQALASQGKRPSNAEHVLELNHSVALTPALSVMPLAQWISRPGGQRDAGTSRVIGARVGIIY